MAYRQSLTTRVKLFYQHQRFSPLFSHIQRDDDWKNSDPRLGNPKIFSSPQNSWLSNGVSGVGRIGNPVLDRGFSAQQLMMPHMSLGACVVRNMSTSVEEGVGQTEFMSDIANVLTDTVVDEAVASQASIVNEVAIAAADSSFPLPPLQHLIDSVHCFTGLNWWTSIIATCLMVRLIALPLSINALKPKSRLPPLKAKMEEMIEDIEKMENMGLSHLAANDRKQRAMKLLNETIVTYFNTVKGLFIRGPIFVCFLLAISNMAEKVPSFKEGGAFWFTDLTTPDSMYILPILTSLSFLIRLECNAQGMTGNPANPTINNVWRFFSVISTPLTATFPKAIFMYWITNNVFSLASMLALKNPEVKKLLGIPIIPSPEPVKYSAAAQSSATDASRHTTNNIVDSQSKDQKIRETDER